MIEGYEPEMLKQHVCDTDKCSRRSSPQSDPPLRWVLLMQRWPRNLEVAGEAVFALDGIGKFEVTRRLGCPERRGTDA